MKKLTKLKHFSEYYREWIDDLPEVWLAPVGCIKKEQPKNKGTMFRFQNKDDALLFKLTCV